MWDEIVRSVMDGINPQPTNGQLMRKLNRSRARAVHEALARCACWRLIVGRVFDTTIPTCSALLGAEAGGEDGGPC